MEPGGQIDPGGGTSIDGTTSCFVRRALQGDEEGWRLLVARISPLLEMQAAYRLRGPLRRLYDAQDLVHEVWLTAYPKLRTLSPRQERMTPVLLRFLSSILLKRVIELWRHHQRREGLGGTDAPVESLRQSEPGWPVIHDAVRGETCRMVWSQLESLSPPEREVIVLRAIEQIPNGQVARRLGEKESAIAMRYARTLSKLRLRLPGSVLDELED